MIISNDNIMREKYLKEAIENPPALLENILENIDNYNRDRPHKHIAFLYQNGNMIKYVDELELGDDEISYLKFEEIQHGVIDYYRKNFLDSITAIRVSRGGDNVNFYKQGKSWKITQYLNQGTSEDLYLLAIIRDFTIDVDNYLYLVNFYISWENFYRIAEIVNEEVGIGYLKSEEDIEL